MDDLRATIQRLMAGHMQFVWNAAKKGLTDILSEEDKLYAEAMLEHDEYHGFFDNAELLHDYQFDPQNETNPFLHVTLQVIIENQLRDEKPPKELVRFYDSMAVKGLSHHMIIHCIVMVFSPPFLECWYHHKPFNKKWYRRLLKKHAGWEPEDIQASMSLELQKLFGE